MTTPAFPVPILGIAAWSGTGKTTLLQRVIPLLCGEGLRIALLKHAHHAFDVDRPGKDSYRLREAGAEQVLVASRQRWVLMAETPERTERPDLAQMLGRLDPDAADLVLVEGFKRAPIPKIELHRPALGQPLLYPRDARVLAVATDAPLEPVPAIPVLDLDAPAQVAGFILDYLRKDSL